MARRTKLIILSIFLVLLATIAVGITLTWTTPNPLRFRIIAYHTASSPGQDGQHGKVRMVAENVSHLPVHLLHADVQKLRPAWPSQPYASIGTVEFGARLMPESYSRALIPPGGSIECSADVFQESDPAHMFRDVEVGYSWISPTALKVDNFCTALRQRVPYSWRPFIPGHLYERERTPLARASHLNSPTP